MRSFIRLEDGGQCIVHAIFNTQQRSLKIDLKNLLLQVLKNHPETFRVCSGDLFEELNVTEFQFRSEDLKQLISKMLDVQFFDELLGSEIFKSRQFHFRGLNRNSYSLFSSNQSLPITYPESFRMVLQKFQEDFNKEFLLI